MGEIRPVQSGDLDALYHIALKTGASGQDAAHLHKDPNLIGHIYAAPYAVLEPGSAFVVEDGEGVGGYIVGTADTRAFDARMEAEWWPALRSRYEDPATPPAAWTADELRSYLIHHPFRTPSRVVDPYPAHLHINLLPRLQGRGFGKSLIDRWLARMRELGAPGAHLGVSTANERGLAFYRAYGFEELKAASRPGSETVWFGMLLSSPSA
jgi:ribosomal protein S18 acetylase RimI-like enzyme